MSVVLAWDLQSGWRGGSVPDLSVVGNNGVCHGFVDASVDGSRFNGVDSYIQSSNTNMTDTNYFIEMLIRPHDITTDQYVCDQVNGDKRAVVLGIQNNYFNFYDGAYPTGTATDTQILAYLDKWQYLVMGTDGTKVYGYSNGVKIVEETGTWVATGGTAFRTGCSGAGANFSNMDVKFVKVHNSILTEDYVKNNWNQIARLTNLNMLENNLLPDNRVCAAGEYIDKDILIGSGTFSTHEQSCTNSTNLFSPGLGSFETDTESWIAYGTNTILRDTFTSHSGSASLKITYVDNNLGAYLTFANATDLFTDLTVGSWYRIRGFAKVNSGFIIMNVDGQAGGSTDTAPITSTDWQFFQLDFEAGHVTDCLLNPSGMGAGQILWIDSLVIQEMPPIPQGTKYIQTITDGDFNFPQDNAYGTWEATVYKHLNADTLRIQLISDVPQVFTNFNGYYLEINGSGMLRLVEVTGAATNVLFSSQYGYGEKVWWDLRVTRTLDGEFHIYSRNTSVRKNWHLAMPNGATSNPVTDTTYTTSNWCVIQSDSGDRICEYRHKLGVIQ